MHLTGFEPVTDRSSVWCSPGLSYKCTAHPAGLEPTTAWLTAKSTTNCATDAYGVMGKMRSSPLLDWRPDY